MRVAQRIGLYIDPADSGLPPVEVEQRRRLWWSIVEYDLLIAEMTGSTVTALSSGGDCKIPLNVNDNDLHIDGRELPKLHTGPTDMLFALTRMKIAMAMSSAGNPNSSKVSTPDKHINSLCQNQSSKSTVKIAGQSSPSYTLDDF